MNRIMHVLALVVAVGIGVVAIYALNDRADDDTAAIPTLLPSPTDTVPPTPVAPESPQDPNGAAQLTTEPGQAPTLTETATPDVTEATEPTPTVAPPRTPSPPPAVTAGPVDTSRGGTPQTGGDSIPAGIGLALAAIGARAALHRRRRSY